MMKHLPAFRLFAGAALLAGTLAAQNASVAPLFQVNSIKGTCEIKRPDASAFEAAVDRKAYPFGTAVRSGSDGSAVILFSGTSASAFSVSVALDKNTVAVVDRDPDDHTRHIVLLLAGEVQVYADRDTPERFLTIETPDYAVCAFSGRSLIRFLPAAAEFITTRVGVVQGGLKILGSQFSIQGMRGDCALLFESAPDRSLTRITAETGETIVTLENGTDEPLPFSAYPGSTIKIWRESAPIGGRLIVAVFAVGADGKRPECYAFAVGQKGMISNDTVTPDADAANDADGPAETTPNAAAVTPTADVAPDPKPATDADAAFKELFGDSFSF